MLEHTISAGARGISVKPNEHKTADENRLTVQALNALNEYSLVKSGAASYESLGYGVPDQGAEAFKLYEYLVIDEAIAEATKDKK